MSINKIVHWNVNGLNSRLPHLHLLLDMVKPQILALQETKLKQKHLTRISNYEIIRKDRIHEDGGGGVCLLIRNDIAFIPVNIKSNLEVIAVKVYLNKTPIVIASIYLAPEMNNQNIEDLMQEIIDKVQGPILLIGDYNAHHVDWGSESSDYRGRMVSEFATKNSLTILNNGEPTYFSQRGGFTHIDLALTSNSIAQQFTWQPYHDLMDSDHFPLILSIINNEIQANCTNYRWNFKNVNWMNYRQELHLTCNTQEPNEMCKEIEEEIIRAADQTIGKKKSVYNPKYSKHWWNDECKKAIKDRNKALYNYKKDRSDITKLVTLKEKQAIARLTVRRAKKASWDKYVEKINKDTSLTEIWKYTKAINGKSSPKRKIILWNKENKLIQEEEEVLEEFALHYATVGETYYDKDFLAYKVIEEKHSIINTEQNRQEYYNETFTLKELNQALDHCKQSAPGPDTIPYKFIQEMQNDQRMQILKFYNHIWKEGKIPQQWKVSQLIPILKPGKCHTLITSYRPIA